VDQNKEEINSCFFTLFIGLVHRFFGKDRESNTKKKRREEKRREEKRREEKRREEKRREEILSPLYCLSACW